MKVTGRKATTGGGRGEDARARTGGPSGSAGGSLGKLPEEATLGLHLKKKQEVSQAGRAVLAPPSPGAGLLLGPQTARQWGGPPSSAEFL